MQIAGGAPTHDASVASEHLHRTRRLRRAHPLVEDRNEETAPPLLRPDERSVDQAAGLRVERPAAVTAIAPAARGDIQHRLRRTSTIRDELDELVVTSSRKNGTIERDEAHSWA